MLTLNGFDCVSRLIVLYFTSSFDSDSFDFLPRRLALRRPSSPESPSTTTWIPSGSGSSAPFSVTPLSSVPTTFLSSASLFFSPKNEGKMLMFWTSEAEQRLWQSCRQKQGCHELQKVATYLTTLSVMVSVYLATNYSCIGILRSLFRLPLQS